MNEDNNAPATDTQPAPATEVTQADLIQEQQPPVVATDGVEFTAPPRVAVPPPVAPAVPLPEQATPGVRTTRSKDWYRDNLDWNKSNSELAKIMGVTRQRISQLRKDLFPDGKVPPAPLNPQPAEPAADFSDIDPTAAKPAYPGEENAAAAEARLAAAPKIVNYGELGAITFDMSTALLVQVFGDEWQPRQAQQPGQKGERDIMIEGIANYYKSKELPDIPPGAMLCFLVTMYTLPRLRAPTTATKIRFGWQWCKEKVRGLFRRKQPSLTVLKKD